MAYLGVLDPEELSIIIGDAETGKHDPLSGVKKETCRSSGSRAKLLSENLSLESLEAELFEDIRASIKKSGKESNSANSRNKGASVGIDPKSSRSSNMANSSCKVASGGADTQAICCKFTTFLLAREQQFLSLFYPSPWGIVVK